jgi:hypothetical protein
MPEMKQAYLAGLDIIHIIDAKFHLLSMKIAIKRLLYIPAFAILLSGCNNKSEKIDLKMNLQKGKTYTYLMTSTQEVKQTAMGQQMQINQNMAFGYKMNVKDVSPEGDQTLETSYDRIKISQKSSFANNEYDSENKKDSLSPMAKLFKALRSGTFTVVMSKDGLVKDIHGYKDIIEKMMTSVASRNDSSREMIKEQITGHFNDKALKESLQNGWNIYPDQPVGIGDSWVKKNSLSAGFPLDLTTTYTVKDITRNKVILTVKSDINPGKDSTTTLMGIEMKIKGSQEGTMEVDRKTGLPLHSNITQEISGAISMANQGSHLEIPMSAKTTTVIEGKEQ